MALNIGAGVGSGISGALSGAAIGSTVPVIGTALGAIGGGVAGLFGGLFGGGGEKKQKPKKMKTMTPEQESLFNDYIASIRGQGPLKGMYGFDEGQYNNVFDKTIGRPAYRNFNENIIPGITGQFRNNNLMNSSYAGDALGRAGRDVQENLDALRSQNVFQGQQQAQMNRQNALNNIIGTQAFAYSQPGEQQPGMVDQILGSLAPAGGKWFADYLAGAGKSPGATPAAGAAYTDAITSANMPSVG